MNGVMNWSYEDVVAVLLANGFTEQTSHKNKPGSHHYFVDEGSQHLVHVQYHAGKKLRPLTLETIIASSGMPKKYWLKVGNLPKRQLKKTPYISQSSSA